MSYAAPDSRMQEQRPSALAPCAGYASSCGRVTLYLGDSVELRHLVPADAAIISDPPYGMDWNTDHTRFVSGPNGNSSGLASKQKHKKIANDAEPFDPSPWLAWEKVVLFGSNHFGARLPVGTKLIWIKRYDEAFGSFLSDAEEAWMKGGHGIYCKRDLTMTGEALTRMHPCQKPVPLMAWCMDKAKVPAGAVVVDPYMGSGSTIIAAIRTGRKAIGFEQDPEHFANAVQRITAELAQGDLFLGHNA
jgi:site-specific DNA-methyltransferase (adenine-specific)